LPLGEQLDRLLPDVVPELWPQLEPVFREVLDTGESVVNRELEALSSGERQQVQFWLGSYYPVSVDTDVIGVGVVLAEITDLKQAEDFRSVVMENMAEGLYAVDHEGRLAFMNRTASKMLGWSEADLHGKVMHDVVHFQKADGSAVHAAECESCNGSRVQGRTIRSEEDAYTRKDGTMFPVSSSAAPLLSGTSVRGAVVVFHDTTEEMEERHRRQRELDALTWVGRIRDALDEDRFVLYSQPIVPLNGGAPSEELLLRMLDRHGDAIPPGAFLPVAEKFGLIGEIDTWVVSRAIALAAASGRRIEANLSAFSISNLDLLSSIEAELGATGADPSDLVFEITETALMENLDTGETFARGLTDLGCGLALDDFGTGFGSFTYLKSMPINYLKIDIDFVRDLPSNLPNQHLVKATVGIARDFGYQTIAEGVEDAPTLELLSEYGVDFAQGFHLGRPAPLETG
jgi:PAS domain S-box-containing protein